MVGGRSPIDSVRILADIPCCTIEWRVQRVSLLLRLLNSPPDSLQHLALATFLMVGCAWAQAAIQDMQIVLPDVELRVGNSPFGAFVFSTGRWNDVGEWLSGQPWLLEPNRFGIYGHRCRTPVACRSRTGNQKHEWRIVQQHIKRVTHQLRILLLRQANTEMTTRMLNRESCDPYSKVAVLTTRLHLPGPPIHVN